MWFGLACTNCKRALYWNLMTRCIVPVDGCPDAQLGRTAAASHTVRELVYPLEGLRCAMPTSGPGCGGGALRWLKLRQVVVLGAPAHWNRLWGTEFTATASNTHLGGGKRGLGWLELRQALVLQRWRLHQRRLRIGVGVGIRLRGADCRFLRPQRASQRVLWRL